jgi:hypothetical protein
LLYGSRARAVPPDRRDGRARPAYLAA